MLSRISYYKLKEELKSYHLPMAMVDLDGVDANFELFARAAKAYNKKIRIATKSLRCLSLIKYLAEKDPELISGLMCYRIREAEYLFSQGLDNLFVAYPEINPQDLKILAELTKKGCNISITADSLDHFNMLDKLGKEHDCKIKIVLELDGSLRALGGKLNLGVRRSSVKTLEELKNRLSFIRNMKHIKLYGVMLYEAQVAGLADKLPFSKLQNPIKKRIKASSIPKIKEFRQKSMEIIYNEGFSPEIINGGGSGSIFSSIEDDSLSEVTVGSGFICSQLFSYYEDLDLQPSIFYAIETVRKPEKGYITCMGGGYVASGSHGLEKQPTLFLPKGIEATELEGFGEVQTPFKILDNKVKIDLGDPIILRHAKAGELAEHFNNYHFFKNDKVVSIEPTYRGFGLSFL